MPIEINEVVVRVSVEDTAAKQGAPTLESAPTAASSVSQSTDKAVEQMLQILRDKAER